MATQREFQLTIDLHPSWTGESPSIGALSLRRNHKGEVFIDMFEWGEALFKLVARTTNAKSKMGHGVKISPRTAKRSGALRIETLTLLRDGLNLLLEAPNDSK